MSGPPFSMSMEEQAQRAQQLLNDPLLMQALRELDDGAVETWRRSTSAQQREDQWHIVTAVAGLVRWLQSKLEDPKLAARSAAARHRAQL